MAKAQKLVNKMKRRERYVREATESAPKMDKSKAVMQDSPGAQKLMRGAQRRMDESWGRDTAGHEPALEYRESAVDLERFDFGGSDFGILMTLDGTNGAAEETEITTVADVASSLNDTYFLYDTPTTAYYVWYNVDAAGTDPEVAGRTGIEVAISEDDTADAVATATASAMDGEDDISASAALAVVTATNEAVGSVADAADGAAPTGFTFDTTVDGVDADYSGAQNSGIRPGDVVQPLSGDLEGRMLEVVSIDGVLVRLDDMATYTSETDVPVRMMLSTVKKSYT